MLTTPKTTSQNRVPYIVEVVVSERKAEQPQHYAQNFQFYPKIVWNFKKFKLKKRQETFTQILVVAVFNQQMIIEEELFSSISNQKLP